MLLKLGLLGRPEAPSNAWTDQRYKAGICPVVVDVTGSCQTTFNILPRPSPKMTVNGQAPSDADLLSLVSELTLEEKISLLGGKNIWETNAVERLNIPSLKVSNLLNKLLQSY